MRKIFIQLEKESASLSSLMKEKGWEAVKSEKDADFAIVSPKYIDSIQNPSLPLIVFNFSMADISFSSHSVLAVLGSGKNIKSAVTAAFEKLVSESSQAVCFFSFKAGVGKSLLAASVSSRGGGRVLLVDMSRPFGAYAISGENTLSWNTLRPLLSDTLSTKKLTSVVTQTENGYDILPAPSRFGENQMLKAHEIARLIEAARKEYDLVIFDLPAFYSQEDMALLDLFDKSFFVFTPEPASLFSEELVTLKEQKSKHTIQLVLNRWDRDKYPEMKKQLEKKIGQSISYAIEDDPDAVWNYQIGSKSLFPPNLRITRDISILSSELEPAR